jgi:hypothetical protein
MIQKNWGKAVDSISCDVMRPVRGFERPSLQWLFVALAVVLVGLAAAEAVGLRRLRGQVESLRASDLNGRIEREQLQARLVREQSAREAFSLEAARLRGGPHAGASQPTLTLSPLTRRGATPPDPTVARPIESQAIELRLLLPPGSALRGSTYSVAVRAWSGGQTIWSRSGLTASTVEGRAMVTSFITGDVFAPGAYEVALTTMSSDNKNADVAAYEIAVRPSADR